MLKQAGEVAHGTRELRIHGVAGRCGGGRVVGFIKHEHRPGPILLKPISQRLAVLFVANAMLLGAIVGLIAAAA